MSDTLEQEYVGSCVDHVSEKSVMVCDGRQIRKRSVYHSVKALRGAFENRYRKVKQGDFSFQTRA